MKTTQWIAWGSMILTVWTAGAAEPLNSAVGSVRVNGYVAEAEVSGFAPTRPVRPAEVPARPIRNHQLMLATLAPQTERGTLEPIWVLLLAMLAGVILAGGTLKRSKGKNTATTEGGQNI